jgi:hypothetical protein
VYCVCVCECVCVSVSVCECVCVCVYPARLQVHRALDRLVCEAFRGLHPLYSLVCVCVNNVSIYRLGCKYTGPWIDWFVKRSGVHTLSISSCVYVYIYIYPARLQVRRIGLWSVPGSTPSLCARVCVCTYIYPARLQVHGALDRLVCEAFRGLHPLYPLRVCAQSISQTHAGTHSQKCSL